MLTLPVLHSVFSSDALLPVISEDYEIGEGIACKFITSGLNDTYFLETSTGKFILRIYKAHWRTKDDILFETTLLNHLQNKDIPVSAPVVRKNGQYLIPINAPEGVRFSVLFTFADGGPSDKEENCALYGQEAAKMHLAMDDFECGHERFTLNLDHLVDQPLRSIRKALAHRPDDLIYLESLSEMLKKKVDERAADLEWGLCHGDLHGGNVHFKENMSLTHFDFDCAGFGWRAYEVAVFQWAKVRGKKKEEFSNKQWDTFIRSYQQEKAVPDRDLQAVPLFVAIREIWLMGLHTGNSHIWGNQWQDDRYFTRNLQFLRDWCEVHSIG